MSTRVPIACVGAGRMGRGIAVVFAYAGHDVALVDLKPRAEQDFARLAKLPLTGGSIRSIAVNAAFFAASEGASVGMRHVLDCARKEFQKLERPVNEADFRLPAASPVALAAMKATA